MQSSLQPRLPLLPPNAKVVSSKLGVAREEGTLVFFNAGGPIYQCSENDRVGRRLAAAMFPELGLASISEMAGAIGVHRNTLTAYGKAYAEAGAEGLAPGKPGPRGPRKLQGEAGVRAQKLLDSGKSNRLVARELDVSEGTIRNAIKRGHLQRPQTSEVGVRSDVEMKGPRARSIEDASAEGGVGVKRVGERVAAATGKLVEASPKFVAAEAVPGAGVLVALQVIADEGMFKVGKDVFGQLKNGYFGLLTMLTTFVFMALLRVKTIEQLPSRAPGEFGLLLGMDRAPEIRTARRKLAEMGSQGLARSFHRALAKRWATQNSEKLGFLYIDGHVRPYHGRTHKLPKTHVQRRRMCMPATTDHWVNDAGAEPLFYVTAPANDGLLSMLDSSVLPQVRELVGAKRRVTLVFDREGWSPKRFQKWDAIGFDVLTYRKGKYDPWSANSFSEFHVETSTGCRITYKLGQRSIRVRKGFWMREVRRLCDDGHQTSIMTTRHDLDILEVAQRMFARWRQENYFKYMRQEFNFDHLPTTAVEQADPDRTVPNPEKKKRKKDLAKVRSELKAIEREYGEAALDNPESQRPTMRGFKVAHGKLGRQIREMRARCQEIEAAVKALPDRVPITEIMEPEAVVRLEQERKAITDAIKMVAYRAETQLALLVGPLLKGREDEARKFLRDVFNLPGDLVPDVPRRRLDVHLHSMANPRSNRTLHTLCELLNLEETMYPGTDLRLVFHPPNLPKE